jgi:transcription initiation factor TFIID subunit TAF12
MHESTFEYLKPTDHQLYNMANVRSAFADFAKVVEANVPAGPDLTYVMRKLRECAMWANVAITRNPDGSPRT